MNAVPTPPANGRALKAWHRRTGVAAAVFLVFLAVTGVLLNHTDALGLAHRRLDAPWVLALYRVTTPDVGSGFEVAGHWVSQVGASVFLDNREVRAESGRLTGAAPFKAGMALAIGSEVLLLAPDGTLIERMGNEAGLPSAVDALGTLADGRLAVRVDDRILVSDADAATWSQDVSARVSGWSMAAPLPEPLRESIRVQYRGPGIDAERLLLDMHSGRILGRWGPLLFDAVAVMVLVIAVTGLWMWAYGRRYRRD
ncbi:MAG: PepSY-associated TM helix domain-containing protein [Gammaproteobacteria bacterium]